MATSDLLSLIEGLQLLMYIDNLILAARSYKESIYQAQLFVDTTVPFTLLSPSIVQKVMDSKTEPLDKVQHNLSFSFTQTRLK